MWAPGPLLWLCSLSSPMPASSPAPFFQVWDTRGQGDMPPRAQVYHSRSYSRCLVAAIPCPKSSETTSKSWVYSPSGLCCNLRPEGWTRKEFGHGACMQDFRSRGKEGGRRRKNLARGLLFKLLQQGTNMRGGPPRGRTSVGGVPAW